MRIDKNTFSNICNNIANEKDKTHDLGSGYKLILNGSSKTKDNLGGKNTTPHLQLADKRGNVIGALGELPQSGASMEISRGKLNRILKKEEKKAKGQFDKKYSAIKEVGQGTIRLTDLGSAQITFAEQDKSYVMRNQQGIPMSSGSFENRKELLEILQNNKSNVTNEKTVPFPANLVKHARKIDQAITAELKKQGITRSLTDEKKNKEFEDAFQDELKNVLPKDGILKEYLQNFKGEEQMSFFRRIDNVTENPHLTEANLGKDAKNLIALYASSKQDDLLQNMSRKQLLESCDIDVLQADSEERDLKLRAVKSGFLNKLGEIYTAPDASFNAFNDKKLILEYALSGLCPVREALVSCNLQDPTLQLVPENLIASYQEADDEEKETLEQTLRLLKKNPTISDTDAKAIEEILTENNPSETIKKKQLSESKIEPGANDDKKNNEIIDVKKEPQIENEPIESQKNVPQAQSVIPPAETSKLKVTFNVNKMEPQKTAIKVRREELEDSSSAFARVEPQFFQDLQKLKNGHDPEYGSIKNHLLEALNFHGKGIDPRGRTCKKEASLRANHPEFFKGLNELKNSGDKTDQEAYKKYVATIRSAIERQAQIELKLEALIENEKSHETNGTSNLNEPGEISQKRTDLEKQLKAEEQFLLNALEGVKRYFETTEES